MKKATIKVILTVLAATLLSGCAFSTNNSGMSESTEATTTTSETTEETTSIAYTSYNIMNLQFKVPDTWNCEKADDSLTFYPEKNNLTISLEVGYLDTIKSAIYDFDSVFEELVKSLPELEGATIDVNKKVSIPDGDFYIGKVDYTATTYKSSTQKYLVIICDVKSGDLYCLGFSSPKKISDENTLIFNEIVNSVTVNYDF